MSKDIGVRVEGLSESIKLLSRVDKGLRKEIGLVMREKTIRIKNEAFARSKQTPGVRRSKYRITKGGYTRRASATTARVGIKAGAPGAANAAIFGAEFGAKTWHVPRGRTGEIKGVSQARMRNRTFPVWRGSSRVIRGKNGPGWIMMPILRKRTPEITKELEKEITDLFIKSARAAGVLTSG